MPINGVVEGRCWAAAGIFRDHAGRDQHGPPAAWGIRRLDVPCTPGTAAGFSGAIIGEEGMCRPVVLPLANEELPPARRKGVALAGRRRWGPGRPGGRRLRVTTFLTSAS